MAHVATGRPSSERARWFVAFAIMAVVVVATLVGVVLVRHGQQAPQASGGVVPPAATSTSTAVATAPPVATPTADPQAAAVLQAYIDAKAAYVHALLNPNPSDPGLAATETGPERLRAGAFIAAAQTLHLTFRGDSVVRDARVLSVSGTTATLSSCDVDTTQAYNAQGQQVNAQTGQPLPATHDPTKPQYGVFHATLVLVGGVWKVYDATTAVVSESACLAG